jgi:hypothetical protein
LKSADTNELEENFTIALKKMEKAKLYPKSKALKTSEKAETVLLLAFEIGKLRKKVFQNDERGRKIGYLIYQALPAIGFYINRLVTRFESASALTALMARSGLQFLFDEFDHLSVSETDLLKDAFVQFQVEERVDELTTCLENWKSGPNDSSDPPFYPTAQTLLNIPASHDWWPEVSSQGAPIPTIPSQNVENIIPAPQQVMYVVLFILVAL